MTGGIRPAGFCRELLRATEASEGRRRRRKRDTTPDAIGLGVKRRLLEEVVDADPDPDGFEDWLFRRCLGAGPGSGGLQAMALSILEEWKLAAQVGEFREWLAAGAPSDDALAGQGGGGACAR